MKHTSLLIVLCLAAAPLFLGGVAANDTVTVNYLGPSTFVFPNPHFSPGATVQPADDMFGTQGALRICSATAGTGTCVGSSNISEGCGIQGISMSSPFDDLVVEVPAALITPSGDVCFSFTGQLTVQWF